MKNYLAAIALTGMLTANALCQDVEALDVSRVDTRGRILSVSYSPIESYTVSVQSEIFDVQVPNKPLGINEKRHRLTAYDKDRNAVFRISAVGNDVVSVIELRRSSDGSTYDDYKERVDMNPTEKDYFDGLYSRLVNELSKPRVFALPKIEFVGE